MEADEAEGRSRLAAFQAELAAVSAEPAIGVRLPFHAEASVPETQSAKVKLFRSLFRGREDVLALGDQGSPESSANQRWYDSSIDE